MNEKVFNGETTATSVTLTDVKNVQLQVFVGGSGIPGVSVEVRVQPPNGLGFYLVEIFTNEDVKSITVPKGSSVRFTTTGASSGIDLEVHSTL